MDAQTIQSAIHDYKTGNPNRAIQTLRQATINNPNNPELHFHLACACATAQNPQEAANAFESCLKLDPNHIPALNNLGNLLFAMGKLKEAEAKIRRVLEIKPDLPQALFNLGKILASAGQFEESVALFRRAIAIDPNAPAIHYFLGRVLQEQRHYAEAAKAYRQSLALNPSPQAYADLSNALRDMNDLDGAIAAARESLRMRPGFHPMLGNLADMLQTRGDLDEALSLYAQLVSERPDDERAYNGYGILLRQTGRTEEAIAIFRKAADLSPAHLRAAQNYLYTLQYHFDDPMFILHEHRKWDAQYAAPLKDQVRPCSNDRTPHRRLRIGYVSADFRSHVMSTMTSAVLPYHDHERFEIYCYSGVHNPDAITARHQTWADVWRHIDGLSDHDFAEQVRSDQIDILIDQTMHLPESRLLAFARKPAPIQVTWCYPGTTGLWAMDYRLTDPYIDPPGCDERYSEKSIRCLETFWPYDPRGMSADLREALPQPSELPAIKNGFVTFGCLNNFAKLNSATIQRWGRLMGSIKQSRLHILAPRSRCRDKVLQELQPFGISPHRVEFIAPLARPDYLAQFRRIDLALDVLPYNGHSTSLDAFWMGVPVLTRVGRTLVGRAGLSQLSNLQLPDFAADDDEQFIALGTRWASDYPGLAEIRRTLRDRMAASPMMNGPRFARHMEEAFTNMWNHWLASAV